MYSPAWDLPSYDPFCLSVLTFLKFATNEKPELVPKIVYCNNPHMAPSRVLPCLLDGEDIISGSVLIIRHLHDKYCPLDYCNRLGFREIAETQAFVYIIETKLNNIKLYNWWAVPENRQKVFELPHYNTNVFPLNIILPRRKSGEVHTYLEMYSNWDKLRVHEQANDVYEILSQRLGNENKFFYGDEPSFLDAITFAHLIVHLKNELPKGNLLSCHLKKYKNLIRFCEVIYKEYFNGKLDIEAEVEEEIDKEEKEETEKEKKSREVSRNGIIFVGIAAIFVCGYYFSYYTK